MADRIFPNRFQEDPLDSDLVFQGIDWDNFNQRLAEAKEPKENKGLKALIDAIGDGVPFCRDNLIKYSSRFGKKDGMSKLDALKIIHYGILLYHFAGFNNETAKSNYETF